LLIIVDIFRRFIKRCQSSNSSVKSSLSLCGSLIEIFFKIIGSYSFSVVVVEVRGVAVVVVFGEIDAFVFQEVFGLFD
jgi:hypothetical protein